MAELAVFLVAAIGLWCLLLAGLALLDGFARALLDWLGW